MADRVDVAGVINDQPVGRYQWTIFAVCWFIAMLDGLDVQAISLAAPAIVDSWGVRPEDLGPALTAGPLGMVLGGMILGPMSDRLGRKALVTTATALFGLFTLLTAFAPTLEAMTAIRLLTGMGLGGLLPNLIALVSEFAPDRRRATLTTVTFSSMPFGSLVGGLLGAWMIPTFGWQALFYVGGVIPLLIALVLPFRLPESIRYLVARGRAEDKARIAHVMGRIAPHRDFPADAEFTIPETVRRKPSVRHIFGPGRTGTTLILTLIVVLNTLMLYFMLNWLPTIMREAGLSLEAAILTTVLLNGGGTVACLTAGNFIDRYGAFLVVALIFLIAGVAVALLGTAEPLVLIPALFAAGFGLIGAQVALYAVVAIVYPTMLRGTGGGFALGAGRVGSILGPAAGGWALALDLPIVVIFVLAAVPGLAAALLMWILARLPRDFGTASAADEPGMGAGSAASSS